MSSDEEGFEKFLNTTGEDSGAGFELVHASNPLEWTRLGQAIVASLIAGIVVGIQTTIGAVTEMAVGLFAAASGWLYSAPDFFRYRGGRVLLEPATGLIPTIRSGIEGIMYAAWAPLSEFGWLAWPVAVAELLLMLYVIMWAIAYVREEVL